MPGIDTALQSPALIYHDNPKARRSFAAEQAGESLLILELT